MIMCLLEVWLGEHAKVSWAFIDGGVGWWLTVTFHLFGSLL